MKFLSSSQLCLLDKTWCAKRTEVQLTSTSSALSHHAHACTCTHTHTDARTHMHTQSHTYTRMHTHTHMHTHGHGFSDNTVKGKRLYWTKKVDHAYLLCAIFLQHLTVLISAQHILRAGFAQYLATIKYRWHCSLSYHHLP